MTDSNARNLRALESERKTESALPTPLFRVLQEERAKLCDAKVPGASWLLEESHWIGDFQKPPPALAELIGSSALGSKKTAAEALNGLLRKSESIRKNDHYPAANIPDGLRTLDDMELAQDDRIRLNRLLLEAAFPEHIRPVDTIGLADHYASIHQDVRGLSSLCISGGGIRSATFGLGILQGLARIGVLSGFDYLSTVSGGGYIGSWLSSWIHRRKNISAVQEELARPSAASPLEPEPEPVRNLRAYSNYLTPRLGFLSADTWTLAGIYLCNLFLNWLVYIPILMSAFALPRFGLAVLHMDPHGPGALSVLAFGILSGIWGLTYSIIYRPSNGDRRPDRKGEADSRPPQTQFLVNGLLPLWVCAVCISTFWVWWNGSEYVSRGVLAKVPPGILYVALGVGMHLASWVISRVKVRKLIPLELLSVFATGLIAGLLLCGIASLGSRVVLFHEDSHLRDSDGDLVAETLYVCLAAPAFFLAFLTASALFVGLTSRITSDGDREWWARMGAWILITVSCWMAFGLLTLLGPLLLFKAKSIVSSLGGLTGIVTLFLARGKETPARGAGSADEGLFSKISRMALALTTPLFIAFLIVLLSMASGSLIYGLGRVNFLGYHPFADQWVGDPLSEHFDQEAYLLSLHQPSEILVGGFILLAAGLGVALSLFIDVNKFSIHALYRNRLVRAYLGASNANRRANPFTGFDPEDDLPISDLHSQRPLHVVNMALNLVGGENLAWQERKAESFTASPLYCGSARLGYRPSGSYALQPAEMARKKARSLRGEPAGGDYEGVSLGTVVAISGAAASPNMGYHSSPVVAALMTIFNIRLGWWLGNPGPAGQGTYRKPAPDSGVLYMAKEAFGLTDDANRFVYLSDGGHFENLGLYEMVLRRARVIVVSDAGCDPTCSLEDLGNAIRKIRVDQGVDITLTAFGIYSRNNPEGTKAGRYCAIGEINYQTADGASGSPVPKGTLIYIKPAILGGEPKDVYNYKETSSLFPHEPTSDQWFSESQFESYRALGFHIIDSIMKNITRNPAPAPAARAPVDHFKDRAVDYTELPLPVFSP